MSTQSPTLEKDQATELRHPFRTAITEIRTAKANQKPERTDLAFFMISFISFFIIIIGMTS
jgi:hypothetical protein